MPINFKHDIKDTKGLSRKLQQLNRSAFPVVVRQTLNNTAIDVKKKTLVDTAKDVFIVRSPSFFKRHSKVDFAKGFEIGKMVSSVGMIGDETKNFHEQEIGGTVRRVAIPNTGARTSQSNKRRIAKRYYLQQNAIVDGNKRTSRRRSNKSQRVADAFIAHKTGKWLWKNETLFEVRRFNKTRSGRVKIKMKPLYSIKRNRSVKIDATNFIEKAALAAIPNMERHFVVAANKQFKKTFK